MNTKHVEPTTLLDYEHPTIQRLIQQQGWRELDEQARIAAIYTYVRDQIPFGYNTSDDRPASAVLADGYGQCNTKTTLLMALLRGSGVPCRFHGATIHKRLQKGVVSGLLYPLAPKRIIHSWAEVQSDGRWVGLEGVILDLAYLHGLRAMLPQPTGEFLGFAVGTSNLANPPIDYQGDDTAIQQTGVDQDFGVFDDPDAFYAQHGTNLTGLKAWVYRRWGRHIMNRKVRRIREAGQGRESTPEISRVAST